MYCNRSNVNISIKKHKRTVNGMHNTNTGHRYQFHNVLEQALRREGQISAKMSCCSFQLNMNHQAKGLIKCVTTKRNRNAD